jgi:hypothetical protein
MASLDRSALRPTDPCDPIDPLVNFYVKLDAPANINRQRAPIDETQAPDALHCGFCGKPNDRACKLAFGRGVCICDECVNRIVEEFSGQRSLAP